MTDIVTSLRTWVHAVDALPASDLMDQAADEIVRLRGDAEVARLRLEAAHAEMGRLRITDAEREAVAAAIGWIESPGVEDEAMPEDYLPITATLRGLLERTK